MKDDQRRPNEAPEGNASNPSPESDPLQKAYHSNQLIDEKGEKYLREVASIEDTPDAQDEADAEEQMQEK